MLLNAANLLTKLRPPHLHGVVGPVVVRSSLLLPAPLRAPPTSPNSASPQSLAPVQAVWDGLKAIGDPWNFIFSIFEIEVNIFYLKRDPTTVF